MAMTQCFVLTYVSIDEPKREEFHAFVFQREDHSFSQRRATDRVVSGMDENGKRWSINVEVYQAHAATHPRHFVCQIDGNGRLPNTTLKVEADSSNVGKVHSRSNWAPTRDVYSREHLATKGPATTEKKIYLAAINSQEVTHVGKTWSNPVKKLFGILNQPSHHRDGLGGHGLHVHFNFRLLVTVLPDLAKPVSQLGFCRVFDRFLQI